MCLAGVRRTLPAHTCRMRTRCSAAFASARANDLPDDECIGVLNRTGALGGRSCMLQSRPTTRSSASSSSLGMVRRRARCAESPSAMISSRSSSDSRSKSLRCMARRLCFAYRRSSLARMRVIRRGHGESRAVPRVRSASCACGPEAVDDRDSSSPRRPGTEGSRWNPKPGPGGRTRERRHLIGPVCRVGRSQVQSRRAGYVGLEGS